MSTANHLPELRARRALQEAGLPFDGRLRRAPSTRNEVFLAGRYVVRFNRDAGDRLSREAAICSLLAGRPWAPEVLAYGDRPGADYLIVARRPGRSLSRCWPTMSAEERREAIHQFSCCLAELHSIADDGSLPPIEHTPHLLAWPIRPTGPLVDGLERLGAVPGIDQGLIADARRLLARAADALDDTTAATMVHGDLTLENVLWDGRRITAVLDFEWCRPGPPDLDLDVLGRYFAIPGAHVSAEAERWQHAEDYRAVPRWMADDYPALFAHPRLADRLLVYALAFEVRDTLANPPTGDRHRLNELHPYNRLAHLVATGGHVGELIEHLGLPIR